MYFYAEHPRPGVRGLPPSLKSTNLTKSSCFFLTRAACLSQPCPLHDMAFGWITGQPAISTARLLRVPAPGI
jgi:hypothetical protein